MGALLAAVVSALAAAFGAWVGYLQYREGHAYRDSKPGSTSESDASATGPGSPPLFPEPAPGRHGSRGSQRRSVHEVPAPASPIPGGRQTDDWTVNLTAQALAARAALAVWAGVVSCVGFGTFVLTLVIVGQSSSKWLDAFLWFLVWSSGAAILVATAVGVWVRRKSRGRYRRPWRMATQALWLAWSPWTVGYLGGVIIGSIVND